MARVIKGKVAYLLIGAIATRLNKDMMGRAFHLFLWEE